MFSDRGVALNVTTASVQLRVLHTGVYLFARLKLRGTNSTWLSFVSALVLAKVVKGKDKVFRVLK
jgi:hypothetical protein